MVRPSLSERGLRLVEGSLGHDHPDAARSLDYLAGIVAAQGNLDGARGLHERALAIHEARLGADHPDTVRSRQDIAAVVAKLDNQQ